VKRTSFCNLVEPFVLEFAFRGVTIYLQREELLDNAWECVSLASVGICVVIVNKKPPELRNKA